MNTNYRIALVDDHPLTRINLGDLLEKRLNAQVVLKTGSGEEFLSSMEQGLQADLVITDLSMPEMDGMALCQKLKALFPHLKILVLSVYSEQGIREKLHRIGIDGFVNKDANIDTLLACIRELLRPEEDKSK